jgi:hypothetical protein
MYWRGSHIQLDRTATGKLAQSWWRCCLCNRELVRGTDIADGLHGRCRKRVGETEAKRLREARRQADRDQYRRDREDGKIEPV